MEKVLQLTAVIEREEDGYVATCPELDVVSQGDTVEEARAICWRKVEGFFEAASPSRSVVALRLKWIDTTRTPVFVRSRVLLTRSIPLGSCNFSGRG